jgi:organic radical activating enzyme
MLTGIHILLSYKCLYECDHCFVYSSPDAEGTFTYAQIRTVLDEASKIGTIKWIYFEGGEPFLYYPLLIEGIRIARQRGFKVGVVTNAYFATTVEDAERWLTPLRKMKVRDLSISDDVFHGNGSVDTPAKIAIRAAKKIGMKVSSICIDKPKVEKGEQHRKKGEPVVGGGVMFKGRAVEKLSKDLPRVDWKEFTECPYEDFVNPERVHVDAFGNVHLCQGISMGNMWDIPLSELVKSYNVDKHPIAEYINSGGPVQLTEHYGVEHDESYVDVCHLCFDVRKKLIDKFPQYLSPKQVYGM